MVFVIKKRLLIIVAIVLISMFVMAGATTFVASVIPNSKPVVVLDAGHGGADGGTVGIESGVSEAVINLAIAKMVKQKLEDEKVKVVMTRMTAKGSGENKQNDMRLRKKVINDTQPSLVVSIHCNKFGGTSRRGAQVFYQGSSNSKSLASIIQSNLNTINKQLIGKNYSALTGDYYILNCSLFPSVIVECGFLSNPDDDALLNTKEHQERIAALIVLGIMGYVYNS